jgi:hypothetical protein
MRISAFPIARTVLASALLSAGLLGACGGGDDDPVAVPEATPTTLGLARIGGYTDASLTDPVGAAEITAFDAASKRLFVVNSVLATVDVLDLANPAAPVKLASIDISALGASVNSVAVSNGLVALAIEANRKTAPGVVAFYNASNLALLGQVTVGALPDMLTFTPDGKTVVVANEGEPANYAVAATATTPAIAADDPEGSISVISVARTGSAGSLAVTLSARTADFSAYNSQLAELRALGVRIFGPGATVAQDLEPEYVTISADGSTAYVTLQENNAIATVNIASATVTAIRPLGTKDHSVAGFGLDPSDEDGGTNTNSGTPVVKIGTWPVRGMYLPDAIASYSVGGQTYLITANEGDARADWPGLNEEVRIRAHCSAGLDPAVFAGATGLAADPLLNDSNLGRLRVTSLPNGNDTGKNAAGQCNKLHAFGARSFSIWATGGTGAMTRVYDSGDELEQRTVALPNVLFNASHDANTLDGRSASKGPEPESVTTAKFGNKTYAFIGLERVGGLMVYDVTTPTAPSYVTYLNSRDGITGDRGPEGLVFVPAAQSPNGKPLLIVGNEVSGSTSVLQVNLAY